MNWLFSSYGLLPALYVWKACIPLTKSSQKAGICLLMYLRVLERTGINQSHWLFRYNHMQIKVMWAHSWRFHTFFVNNTNYSCYVIPILLTFLTKSEHQKWKSQKLMKWWKHRSRVQFFQYFIDRYLGLTFGDSHQKHYLWVWLNFFLFIFRTLFSYFEWVLHEIIAIIAFMFGCNQYSIRF